MKKIYILTTLFLAIGITGCKKDFLSQEINPNQASVATPGALLAGALVTTAGIPNGSSYNYLGVWMGQTCPSGNYVPSSILETYNFTSSSFQVFNPIYTNLSNYKQLITQTTGNASMANYTAIAMVMSAYDYEMLVDNYNDVPYSQALNSAQYLFPAYDPGSSIYDALLTNLDNAIGLMSSSAASPGTSDIVFGSVSGGTAAEMADWAKFANSLKLRIAIRQYTTPSLNGKKSALQASIAKTASLGYLDNTLSANANPGYTAGGFEGQQSPFYLYYGYSVTGAEETGHAYYRANKFEVTMLNTTNDPRLTRIFAPGASATTVIGNVLGSDATNVTNATAGAWGPGLDISATMPAVLMSGAESCFLLSEAVNEGLISGNTVTVAPGNTVTANGVQDYYNRGVAASFSALGVPSAATAATAYLGQAGMINVDLNANATSGGNHTILEAIITQKYIALTGYGQFEIYNEWRRTGYPLNIPRSTAAGALGTLAAPNRIFYPTSEFNTNLASVSAEPTVNVFSSKIFWAK